jgi:hypothetical protein
VTLTQSALDFVVGLDFLHGLLLQAALWKELRSPVNYLLSNISKNFFLDVSFGRCKWRLSYEIVGLLLQSVIGGHGGSFKIVHLADRVFYFRFSPKVLVSSSIRINLLNVMSSRLIFIFGIMVV